MIGKIQRVPLRDIWKHEAYDFTCWIQENIDVINDVLDLNLSNVEREQTAGNLSVDLIAEDDAGNAVIIENQLEKSNHDHLGKVITYLAVIGAKTAIWIVAEPRPEHVSAIAWLNESTAANFYLLKVEGICIENSKPAPLITLIVGPSEETREVGKTKEEIAERFLIRKRFWTGLLERAKEKTKLHANISPSQHSWIGTGAGKRGLALDYVIRKNEADVELYIDSGKESGSENKQIFDILNSSKSVIEKEFGGPLEWQRLDNKRACRIKKTITIGGYRSEESEWSVIQEAMIDAMIRLDKSLKPFIQKLKISES